MNLLWLCGLIFLSQAFAFSFDEISSSSFGPHAQRQFDAFKMRVETKLASLEQRCESFSYDVDTRIFKNPYHNRLIRAVNSRMLAIAEIMADDIKDAADDVTERAEEILREKFSVLTNVTFQEVEDGLARLTNTDVIDRVQRGMNQLASSITEGVKEIASTRSTRVPERTIDMQVFMELIHKYLKVCSSSSSFQEEDVEKIRGIYRRAAETKGEIMNSVSIPSCPSPPIALMDAVAREVEAKADTLPDISDSLKNLETEVARRLEEINRTINGESGETQETRKIQQNQQQIIVA